MKYIKKFESNEKINYNKFEFIKAVDIYHRDEIYLTIKESYNNDAIVRAIYIGKLNFDSYEWAYYKPDFKNIHKQLSNFEYLDNNHITDLNEKETNVLFNGLRKYSTDKDYKIYFDVINNIIGKEITELPKYKDWLFKNDTNKYNI